MKPTSISKYKNNVFVISIFLVVIILGILLLSNNNRNRPEKQSVVVSPQSFQQYSNAQEGFSIEFPKDWRIIPGQGGAVVMVFNTVNDKNNQTSFTTNMNVVVEPAKGLSLEQYIEGTKYVLSKETGNQKLIDDRAVTLVDGTPAYIIGGIFNFESYEMRNIQLITIHNDKAYIIGGTALPSTWDVYEDLFLQSLMSFKFTK